MERKNFRKSSICNKIIGNKKWEGAGVGFSNHGYVLIFSLWAIVIFGFIAVSFTRNTGIAIKTENAFTERIKNIYAARGACIYATQMMLQSENQDTENEETSQRRKSKRKNSKKKAPDTTNERWESSSESYQIQIGDRDCEVFISDESSKININKITDDTKQGFLDFLISFDIDERDAEIMTDSILDWIDSDDLHHINGAEKSYYDNLEEPYEPKNGNFDTLEELTLVRGVTAQIYEKIRNSITVYGSGKINVNFAPKEALLLVPNITPEVAEAIILYRSENGSINKFRDLKELFRGFGIVGKEFQETVKHLTVYDSNYFTIHSIATMENMENSYKIIVRTGSDNFRIVAAYPE